jgi:hypothetical protein
MEIRIDSFASAMYGTNNLSGVDALEQLLEGLLLPTRLDWMFSVW